MICTALLHTLLSRFLAYKTSARQVELTMPDGCMGKRRHKDLGFVCSVVGIIGYGSGSKVSVALGTSEGDTNLSHLR